MWNRRIAARQHFAHDAVAIVHVGMAIFFPFIRREAWMHPHSPANDGVRIEGEEAIRLPVVMDIVTLQQVSDQGPPVPMGRAAESPVKRPSLGACPPPVLFEKLTKDSFFPKETEPRKIQ